MADDITIETAPALQLPGRPSVSSGNRGRPIADLLERAAGKDPEAVAGTDFSPGIRAALLVRQMRKSCKFSQQALAIKVGVSQERISQLECGGGPQGPTFELLDRIATACGMRIMAISEEQAKRLYDQPRERAVG